MILIRNADSRETRTTPTGPNKRQYYFDPAGSNSANLAEVAVAIGRKVSRAETHLRACAEARTHTARRGAVRCVDVVKWKRRYMPTG